MIKLGLDYEEKVGNHIEDDCIGGIDVMNQLDFKVDHLCPKLLLYSIFHIPYAHINSLHIILKSIPPSLISLGLPLPFFPSTFILITTLTAFVSSHLITCPNHLSIVFRILSIIDATPILPLTYSLLILSIFSCLLLTHPSKHSHFHDTRTLIYSPVNHPTLQPI
ncbi:Uncharacterized protein FWK35_00021881 [Aphis craccivora]|uniref:Uncharacterized protein n=1 Tax=Aphis craccivora TaxID=307492 RepID=A0A6G0Y497_APHCR|nr:Uncharacterized protein FWK35_00021881 [Aphis craccivora]